MNPYEVLGVQRGADAEDIKRAYKRLARQFHPDVNPSEAAAERFQQAVDAYAILSDELKRGLFDEFGAASLEPGFDPTVARSWSAPPPRTAPRNHYDFDNGGFGDFFSSLFDESERESAPATVDVPALLAFTGGELRVSSAGGPATVRVAAGCVSGDVVRAATPSGSVSVELRVADHPFFRRNGDDLELDLPVTVLEALDGATIEVPTPLGPRRVNVPPGCSTGRLRLRGLGVQRAGSPGSLLLIIRVHVPSQRTPDLLAAARLLDAGYGPGGVRAHLAR